MRLRNPDKNKINFNPRWTDSFTNRFWWKSIVVLLTCSKVCARATWERSWLCHPAVHFGGVTFPVERRLSVVMNLAWVWILISITFAYPTNDVSAVHASFQSLCSILGFAHEECVIYGRKVVVKFCNIFFLVRWQ